MNGNMTKMRNVYSQQESVVCVKRVKEQKHQQNPEGENKFSSRDMAI